MRNTILVVIAFLLWGFIIAQQPQDMPTVIPPSPTVANLMQFEEVPIDYYSGQPNIAVPLFSKNIHKDLAMNLSLAYNTQGVKIDNRSGWTGTGWSLFAGGVISRTVRDIPDESYYRLGDGEIGVHNNDDFWNYWDLSPQKASEFAWYAIGDKLKHYDTKLDLYQFNFLGFSGRFTIVKENGILVPKLIDKNQRIRIEIDYQTETRTTRISGINYFIITDTRGYKYYFDEVLEETRTSSSTISEPNGSNTTFISKHGKDHAPFTSAWHLSKITTSNDIIIADFDYTPVSEEYLVSKNRTSNTITYSQGGAQANLGNTYNHTIFEPKFITSQMSNKISAQKLSKITFRDGSSIDFSIRRNHPENKGAILDAIIIKDPFGSENKRFVFDYEETRSRLWLNSVSEEVGNQSQTYHFSYFNKEQLPPFNSSYGSWGYNFSVPYDKDAIKAGLLTQIEYPTGGVKEFEFEEHTFSYQGATPLTTEDFYDNPDNTEGKSDSGNFTATMDVNPRGQPGYNFTHEQEITVNLYNVANLGDQDRIRIHVSSLSDSDIGGSAEWYPGQTDLKLIAPAGSVSLIFQHIGIPNHDPVVVTGEFHIKYSQLNTTNFSEFLKGGGVRIKEVRFKDHPNTPAVARRISYDYSEPTNSNTSSGVVDHISGSMKNKYRIGVNKFLFRMQENVAGAFYPTRTFYDVETTGTRVQLTRGGYVGYKNVKVSQTNLGYTLYQYTTAQDYPTPSQVFTYPFIPGPNLDFKRGLLQKKEVYNQAGQKLQEIENKSYNFVEETIVPSYEVLTDISCEYLQFYETFADNINANPSKNLPIGTQEPRLVISPLMIPCGNFANNVVQDDLQSGWAQLKETETRNYTYDTSGNQSVIETKEAYDYDTFNYQLDKTTRTISIGGTTDSYINDVSYTGIPKGLSLNIINEPTNVRDSKQVEGTGTPGSGYNLINEVNKTFKEFSPDMVAVEKVQLKKGSATSLEDRLIYHDYDIYGNPLEVSKSDGTHIVYIWGYNEEYPIAKIENATYSQVESYVANLQTKSNADNDRTMEYNGNEGALREDLDTLRDALPNAMVSTYTYDPLVGVTSITDPRGYTMYYEYDAFNRLQQVKDQNGNILSENQYHYKNN